MLGFVTNFLIQSTTYLAQLALYCTAISGDMVSADRILQLGANKSEDAAKVNEKPPFNPSAAWPTRGEVEISHYSGRYRENVPLSLRDINLSIRSNEKLAVIGRTGAGKSSLSLSLVRAFEAEEGSITIDGVNIADVKINDLRSKFSIIPQRCVAFTGSLRDNLDLEGLYDDSEIISVVRECALDKVLDINGNDLLDFQFVDGG